jgi:hypothetical protein
MLHPQISEVFVRDDQNLPPFSSAGQASDPTEHSSQGCLLCRDKAKSRCNVTSPSQCRVVSL